MSTDVINEVKYDRTDIAPLDQTTGTLSDAVSGGTAME